MRIPNESNVIARLYDAGVSADGTPFMALEYVEGLPIDRYCADRALDSQGARTALPSGREFQDDIETVIV